MYDGTTRSKAQGYATNDQILWKGRRLLFLPDDVPESTTIRQQMKDSLKVLKLMRVEKVQKESLEDSMEEESDDSDPLFAAAAAASSSCSSCGL